MLTHPLFVWPFGLLSCAFFWLCLVRVLFHGSASLWADLQTGAVLVSVWGLVCAFSAHRALRRKRQARTHQADHQP
jgi:hypothetical protein